MALDALVFDFDGLILDTEWSEYVTIRDEYRAHGLTLELDDWCCGVGRADNPHWTTSLEEALGRSIDLEVVRDRRRAAHEALILREPILPGVVSLLDQAESAGVPTGLASSSPTTWVVPHLERIGLAHRFATVACREHVARGKPAPDVYLAAAAALGADPARSVALEDSHNGSLAARAAGFWCVVVRNAVTRAMPLPAADLILGSLVDVDLEQLDGAVSARVGPSPSA